MTVIVTINVAARFRGFLASTMLEITPGVYTSPAMTSGIRDRVWNVLSQWFYNQSENCTIVMTWRDPQAEGRQQIRILGDAPKKIVNADGVYLVKHR